MSETSSAFRFVEDPHGYWEGGEELPSPSSVFQDLGLVDRRWYTAGSRARGIAVHGYLRFFLKGTLDWASVDKRLLGYVTSGARLFEKLNPKVVTLETPLWHPGLRFAGTLDAEWISHGVLWINDYKTGKAPKVAQIATAAYAMLARERQRQLSRGVTDKFWRRCAIELFEDGTIANRVPHDDIHDAAAWLNLLGAHRVRQHLRARPLAYQGEQ